jgi:osmoprotectant transport system permease protein
MPQHRVLLVLALLGLAAALGLSFLSHAANRLVTGMPMGVGELFAARPGATLLLLVPAVVLLAIPFLPPRPALDALAAAAAASLLLLLPLVAGLVAASLAATAPPMARTSLGGGFWCAALAAALALADALSRLRASPLAVALCAAAVAAALAALVLSGALDDLALVREYAARRELLAAALVRHAGLVAAALAPSALLGVWLGARAARRRRFAGALFPILNVVQTVPSIALFGLLLAPLSALAQVFPRLGELGIGGVGVAPAVIALALYALLPIARSAAEGLGGVAPAPLEAGRGLGMSERQLFWRIAVPLALPVILSGLRVAAIQAVGLAAVAALIGAGGLGAIMFQGLFADALDLVLLGVIPIVTLALVVDAVFRIGIARVRRVPR